MSKIFNKRNMKIYNWIFVVFILLIFEFGYCNIDFTKNLLGHKELTTFYFSLCRAVVYIAAIVAVILVNKSNLLSEIEATYQFKSKKIITVAYIILAVLTFGYFVYRYMFTEESLSLIQLSMIAISLLLGLTTVLYLSKNYTVNIIVIGMLASMFAMTMNTYHVLDEKRHFMSAYNVSYGNFNFGNPIVDKQFMEELPRGTHYDGLTEYFKVSYQYEQGSLPEESTVDSLPAPYNPILYIPSALGILIGRILQGSVADIFLLGRFFNLMTYLGITILTVKILPFKKNIAYLLLTIPMFLCFGATYSIDGLGSVWMTLFLAYCLKLYDKKETITMKQLTILAFIFAILLTFKSMSLILAGIIVLILPIKDIIKNNPKKVFLLIVGFVLLSFGLFKLQQPVSIEDTRYENVNSTEQIKNIIHHPLYLIEVIKNHTRNTLLNYNWLKDFNAEAFFSNTASNLFFIMLLYYFYVAFKDDSKNFGIKEKLIFILAFSLVYISNSLILYISCTPVGANAVGGYQTRYIFPIIPLLAICCSNKNLKKVKQEDELIRITWLPIGIMLLDIVGAILL